MAKLARRGSKTPEILGRAYDFLAAAGARSLRSWMVRRFRFVPDPPGVELLKSPHVMLNEWRTSGQASGDCDDAAILSGSLALAMGLPVRWVLLGFTPTGPFRHVYAEACDGSRWVDFDVTRPAQFPEGLRIHRRLYVSVTP